jgi:hypothetical protein
MEPGQQKQQLCLEGSSTRGHTWPSSNKVTAPGAVGALDVLFQAWWGLKGDLVKQWGQPNMQAWV